MPAARTISRPPTATSPDFVVAAAAGREDGCDKDDGCDRAPSHSLLLDLVWCFDGRSGPEVPGLRVPCRLTARRARARHAPARDEREAEGAADARRRQHGGCERDATEQRAPLLEVALAAGPVLGEAAFGRVEPGTKLALECAPARLPEALRRPHGAGSVCKAYLTVKVRRPVTTTTRLGSSSASSRPFATPRCADPNERI